MHRCNQWKCQVARWQIFGCVSLEPRLMCIIMLFQVKINSVWKPIMITICLTSYWHLFFHPVRKLNTHCRWKVFGFSFEPSLKNRPRPLDTPDGCNSNFFYFVTLWAWLMYGHLYAIYGCQRAVSKCHSGWLKTWMNIGIHVFHWKLFVIPHICVLFYPLEESVFCFSSLYPSMHKPICCSNHQNVVTHVHCIQ